MFLGDKGKPNKYHAMRLNYDIVIDNEKFTLQKMTRKLGFYTIIPEGKIKDVEMVYDTDKNLLTGAGIMIRKKHTPKRTYFSLVRTVSMANIQNRERKSFLGECEPKDQPSDFPVQIANEINKIFNNLFTINLVDVVKHCTPYIRTEISGNRYKIVSGTGYEVEMSFENLKIKDMRTGRKGKKRIFSLKMQNDPNYEREKERILEVIDKYCKELVPVERNRFEISQVVVRPPIPQQQTKPQNNTQVNNKKTGKKEKKSKKKEFKNQQ
ncbi:MAG: hypothetical protein E7375_01615 [Clostridiales bacterium]|nr:hypothetical protein [Clostridiales bacterium]